ncbi:MAG: hypothetical protein HXS54_01340 [Theionarchaea archaeon]|nr:hypothetical protein [Theionarchaea archaeon]
MKSMCTLIFILFLSSFSFFEASASTIVELREFYQEGNNYVITAYCSQSCTVEFYYKEQNAAQGAYQLIGSLPTPNHGNLFRIKWDITPLADGNYTILIKGCESQIEANVSINKAHWEISPVILRYPGSANARYVGDIKGTVDVHPSGGTLTPYSQYFIFTKESEGLFRITALEIPQDLLYDQIFFQLYSSGFKWGTLLYSINDDTLEVRVTFEAFSSYSPSSAEKEEEKEETEEPPNGLSNEILNELREIKNQNENLNQEVVNLHTKISEKDQAITDLQGKIQEMKIEQEAVKKEEEKKREEQNKQFLLYVVIISGVIAGAAAYAMSKKQTQYRPPPRQDFMHGRPFNKSSSERKEVKIPALVILAAQNHNLDIEYLNKLVQQKKAEKPHLDTERALNEIINTMRDSGEI